jgi:hypothetical protein
LRPIACALASRARRDGDALTVDELTRLQARISADEYADPWLLTLAVLRRYEVG